MFSFYNRMEHLVVVNPMFIEDLVAAGIPREKVTYIPNFVNKEKWHALPAEQVAQLGRNGSRGRSVCRNRCGSGSET